MSEETMADSGQGTAKKRSSISLVRLAVFLIIVAAIVAAGYYFLIGHGGAVAVVNGQKISRSVYDARYAQLAASVASQGQSATTTEMQTAIKSQVLDNLITETLLLQKAAQGGIKTDKDSVNTQFTQSKAQFADTDAFQKALTDQGYTESTFKDYLTRADIIKQYIVAHTAVNSAAATDAEISELYQQVAATDLSIPPLEKVRAEVENRIIQAKQQTIITNFVDTLKASSTIETLI